METNRLRLNLLSGALVLTTIIVCTQAAGPWCFACKDVFHPAICQSVVQCGEHEFCHTEKTLSNNGAYLYTTSCKDENLCKTRVKRAVSRSLLCDQCCNGTLCNAEGCGAQSIKTPQQRYCLSCDFVQNPSDCDRVDVCSVDKVCSVSADKKFTFPFYKLGCRAKTSCPPTTATLAKDNNICCDTDLCNSNDLGVSPSQYTTTPVPTTRKPAKPVVKFDNTTLEYKVTHAPNEEMKLLCHVTGGPVPSVDWTFDNGTGSVPVTSGISAATNGDSILSIPDPDKSNSGTYTCTATNPLGNSQQDLTVVVLNPPKIEGSLNISKDIQYQGDITLDCNVTMDNATTVHWIIPPTVKSYKIHPNNSLTLFNVHNENNADYLCVAENADGNTTKSFSVSVNDTSSPQTTPAPCTCPTVTVTPCPTLPSTTTPLSTSMLTAVGTRSTRGATTQTTTPTTASTTSRKTTPVTTQRTSTLLSSTPSTTTRTTPSTTAPTTSTTKSTSTTSTTPQNMKTLQTANVIPTSPHLATVNPHPTATPSHRVHDQFQSEKRTLNIMLCPTGGNGNQNVTWHRLIRDFDHQDPVYIANNVGVFTISSQMTILTTGVYECRIGNVPIAQFVVYGNLPNSVLCSSVFGDFTKTEGVVMRASCPPCPNPLSIRPTFQPKINDFLCESAIAKGFIPASGGVVTYLVTQGGNIALLDENAGDILVK